MSKHRTPPKQCPEPQPFSCGFSTRAWAWGDELLLGFHPKSVTPSWNASFRFPNSVPQVLTAPVPHVLRVTGREGVNNRLLGHLRQERSQRQDQPDESAPCMLLLRAP